MKEIKPIVFRLHKNHKESTYKKIQEMRETKGALNQYVNEAIKFYETFNGNIQDLIENVLKQTITKELLTEILKDNLRENEIAVDLNDLNHKETDVVSEISSVTTQKIKNDGKNETEDSEINQHIKDNNKQDIPIKEEKEKDRNSSSQSSSSKSNTFDLFSGNSEEMMFGKNDLNTNPQTESKPDDDGDWV